MTMITCGTCVYLTEHAKEMHWSRWHCMAAPLEEINPVTGILYDPPYVLCRFRNRNFDCPDYKTGPNCIQPKEIENAHQ